MIASTAAGIPAAAQVLEHEPLGSVVLDRLVFLSKPLQNLFGHDGPALPVLIDEAEDGLPVHYVRAAEEHVPETARIGRSGARECSAMSLTTFPPSPSRWCCLLGPQHGGSTVSLIGGTRKIQHSATAQHISGECCRCP